MTLIIGLLAKERIVLAADGAEFIHNPGQRKYLAVTDRKKLFGVPGRSIVISLSGLNRLVALDGTMDFNSQRLISEVVSGYLPELAQIASVQGIAHRLWDLLHKDTSFTLKYLYDTGSDIDLLRIAVFGFDLHSGVPIAYEQDWTPNHHSGVFLRTDPNGNRDLFLDGSGKEAVLPIIWGPAGRFHKENLEAIKDSEFDSYLRELYLAADALQDSNHPEFGGDYTQVSIRKERLDWSIIKMNHGEEKRS